MGAIINSEGASSHWYHRDGSPQHRVPYADKKRAAAGETKRTTLADARKMGLLPSVTNILGMVDKPALRDWRDEQLLIAASANPFDPERETLSEWMRRIHASSGVIVEEARAIGLAAHIMIEGYAKGTPIPVDPVARIPFGRMREWFNLEVKEVVRTESTAVADDYAGTLDMICSLTRGGAAIVDYKTRRGGWKIDRHGTWRCATYPEDMVQLAAYRHAVCEAQGVNFHDPEFLCISVIAPVSAQGPELNSRVPNYHEHRWTIDEMVRGREAFRGLLAAWKALKSYDPSTPI